MPKELPLTLAQLQALAREYGTPLQLYDETGIRDSARRLYRAYEGKGFRFTNFFAVKALPNPAVLAILREEGCGMDCSSTGELWVSERLGIKGSEIMYSSNYTSVEDLKKAVAQRVIINLDDVSLVDSLHEACKQLNVPYPELACFRVNPGLGNTGSETKSNVLGGPSAKFGVPLEQVVEAYQKAQRYGATRFGIHMMTGSNVMVEQYWGETVDILLETVGKLKKELLCDAFEFINIGGGTGIPYRPEQAEVALDDVAEIVRRSFEKHLGKDPSKWPRLCMENGRFLTGPHGYLVARCHAVKNAYGTRFFGLDANMANLMRPGMYGAYHHITVPEAVARDPSNVQVANVVGTLCENNDWFASQRTLPAAIRVGDLFVIHDTGAHSHSMGFQYNAKLRAPEVIFRRGPGFAHDLVRRRETIEDLFSNTSLPPRLRPSAGGRVSVNLPLPDESDPRGEGSASNKRRLALTFLAAVAVAVGLKSNSR